MKNWKTTGAGVSAIIIALGQALGAYFTGGLAAVPFATLLPTLIASGGLIFAKDKNVTGGTVKQ